MAPQPSTWRGRSEQILLNPVGREAGKIPAEGDVFFLDFYLYRTVLETVVLGLGEGIQPGEPNSRSLSISYKLPILAFTSCGLPST